MQYRHGDVIVQQVRKLPEMRRKLSHTILAHGEITGHCHRIQQGNAGALYETSEGLFLEVTGDTATLVHEEHASISLTKGVYRVWRQREYSPEEIRTIRD